MDFVVHILGLVLDQKEHGNSNRDKKSLTTNQEDVLIRSKWRRLIGALTEGYSDDKLDLMCPAVFLVSFHSGCSRKKS